MLIAFIKSSLDGLAIFSDDFPSQNIVGKSYIPSINILLFVVKLISPSNFSTVGFPIL